MTKEEITECAVTRRVYGFQYELGAFLVADRKSLSIENIYSSIADDWDTEITAWKI